MTRNELLDLIAQTLKRDIDDNLATVSNLSDVSFDNDHKSAEIIITDKENNEFIIRSKDIAIT